MNWTSFLKAFILLVLSIKCIGNPGSSSTYSDQQQRTFSPSYSQQQQTAPHYAPHSPSSPITSASSYHYSSRLSSPTGSPVSAPQHHGMNYSNPQQQALYSSALSPGHYGSPNHGKFLVKILTELTKFFSIMAAESDLLPCCFVC
jgi:hypothetical protein